jgi:hypothetical protein
LVFYDSGILNAYGVDLAISLLRRKCFPDLDPYRNLERKIYERSGIRNMLAPVKNCRSYKAGDWWQESEAGDHTGMIGQPVLHGCRSLNGRIVGMARVISDGFSDAYVQDVVVLKHIAGSGWPRAIAAYAICVARKLPDWANCRPEHGFYEDLGYASG